MNESNKNDPSSRDASRRDPLSREPIPRPPIHHDPVPSGPALMDAHAVDPATRRRTSARPTRSAKARRRGALVLTGVGAIAGLAAVVLLNVLSLRFSYRFDVTATNEQSLSPRTQRILDRVTEPVRVVVAADLTQADTRVRTRLVDTLRDLERLNSNVSSTIIDVSREDGRAQFKGVVRDLAERDRDVLREQTAAIELARGSAAAIAGYLNDQLSSALLEVRSGVSPGTAESDRFRQDLEQAAALARNTSRDLIDATTRANELLAQTIEGEAVPATDRARDALAQGIDASVSQMGRLVGVLRAMAASRDAQGPAADAATAVVPDLERRREQANVVLESLRTLKRPDVLRVADALRAGSAVLVIGPRRSDASSVAAIDAQALLPDSAWVNQAGLAHADLARRSEELLSTALGALVSPTRSIVVFVHSDPQAIFDRVPIIDVLRTRLSMRGVDTLEWFDAGNLPSPSLSAIDPERRRPVVYVVLPPDSSSQASTPGGETGLKRARGLVATLEALVDDGRSVMLSLNPSIAPSFGDTDPFALLLDRYGLAADTGRPIVTEAVGQTGRLVSSDRVVQSRGESEINPIPGAIKGLPVVLAWPIAISPKAAPDNTRVLHHPLLSISADDRAWGESQWLTFWQTPRQQRAIGVSAPRFDKGPDMSEPGNAWASAPTANVGTSEWVVAVAAERSRIGSPGQRMVVVGANGWFMDAFTSQMLEVDGRRIPAYPGNLELFEAASMWLSGQDDLIAQSPTALSAPIIKPLTERQVRDLRIALMLGMPLLVLILGGAYRLIRG